MPDDYEQKNQLEKCEILDELGLIHWSKNNKPSFKRYLPENPVKFVPNLWDDIPPLPPQSKERLGYPTQKPQALLERIINASTKVNDLVLDPFCGCGTAIHAAQKTKRQWIGIDITHLAIGLIEFRMYNAFGIRPDVEGIPKSMEGAMDLFRRDPHQFQLWAVTCIKGIKPNSRKTGDRGVDGVANIPIGLDGKKPRYAKVVVSVKGGKNLTPGMLRDLAGTMRSEGAEFGIFVCLHDPTPGMRKRASDYGMVDTPLEIAYPRMQIFTIRDYFDGRQPKLPNLSQAFLVAQLERMGDGRGQTTIDQA